MRRTQLLQEVRKVRFEEILRIWTEDRMSQEEAAKMLDVCSRTFRRHIERHHEEGQEGPAGKRLTQASARKAPVDGVYRPAFNRGSMVPAAEEGNALVPAALEQLENILCEQHERIVSRDNCVSFEDLTLQIPADRSRCNHVKATVRVHRSPDGTLALLHGPCKLASYTPDGSLTAIGKERAARLTGQPICHRTGQFYLLPSDICHLCKVEKGVFSR